jgi:hypothetical protein
MHEVADILSAAALAVEAVPQFMYTFENFFHPFVGELIEQLNKRSLEGFFDSETHEKWKGPFFTDFYTKIADITCFDKEIDVSTSGPYANYNWELLYHFPLAIAVHLSKNQRFAEAQRWFHYIFNPTDNSPGPTPERFWKVEPFHYTDVRLIEQILVNLAQKQDGPLYDQTVSSINEWMA